MWELWSAMWGREWYTARHSKAEAFCKTTMVITYHSGEFIKASFGDTVLAFNPVSKDSKLKPTKFGADVVIVTTDHPDTNGVDQVSHGARQPFVVDGPGEYEIKGVLIKGYATTTSYGGQKRSNTVYLVKMEGILLLFLGATDVRELPQELRQQIEGVDILFVPVGGEGVLSHSEAWELVVSLEPHVTVPIHYDAIGKKGSLEAFLKEADKHNGKPVDKLVVRRKDVEALENEVVVLDA